MLDKTYPDLKSIFIEAYNHYVEVDKEVAPMYKAIALMLASSYQKNSDEDVRFSFGDVSNIDFNKFDEITVKIASASFIYDSLREELFELINRQMQFLTERSAQLNAKENRDDWEEEELATVIPGLILELDQEVQELNSKYSAEHIVDKYVKLNEGVKAVALANGYEIVDVDGQDMLISKEEAEIPEIVKLKKKLFKASSEYLGGQVARKAEKTNGLPPEVDRMLREELSKMSSEDLNEILNLLEFLEENLNTDDDSDDNEPK